MTVLSSTTVALGGTTPSAIVIYDWKRQQKVTELGGFSGPVVDVALTPSGLLAVGSGGNVRLGDLDTWDDAVSIYAGKNLTGCAPGLNGFVTTDREGKVSFWRDNVCVATFTDGWTGVGHIGQPIAFCGKFVLVRAADDSALVFA